MLLSKPLFVGSIFLVLTSDSNLVGLLVHKYMTLDPCLALLP
jgi:hypothetical protein